MSVIRCLSVCGAALSIALFMGAAPAGAFNTEAVPSGSGEGAAPSTKAGGPALHLNEGGPGASPNVLILTPRDGTTDKSQSGNAVRGSTFDPEETRFVFGPFNHFGYGSANQ
jgi:hypothetical protein